MPTPSLALVIPTYRRSEILRQNLLRMKPALIANNVALYISDDSPDDDTRDMIGKISAHFPTIHYRVNSPPLGHDQNIVKSLLWPEEDYVWILGDAGWVGDDAFSRILENLDGQDFIFVNSHAEETKNDPHLLGEKARHFVRDYFWHQTLTGATIYSRQTLDWLRERIASGIALTPNFPHLAIITDFMADHKADIGWIGTRSTFFGPKNSYWRKQALAVFVEDWSAAVRRHASVIQPSERPAVLRSHSARTGLFGTELLMELRRNGALNGAYLRNHPDVRHAVHLPPWLLTAIATIPVPILTTGLRIARRLRAMHSG